VLERIGAKDPRLAGSTTGVPQNRGLQLGEEQAPLISLPDFRRPETAYASYSRRLLNAGRRFLQILGRQVLYKCLNHNFKQGAFIFPDHYLGRPDLFGEHAVTRPGSAYFS
jgi:hypothetical protein